MKDLNIHLKHPVERIVLVGFEDKKTSDLIVTAICKVYETDETTLLNAREYFFVGLRQQLFFLIKRNTDLKEEEIAFLFKMSRQRIISNIEQAQTSKKLYGSVQRSMRKIVELINLENGLAFNY